MWLREWFKNRSSKTASKEKQVVPVNIDGTPDFASFATCLSYQKFVGLYLDGSVINYLKISIPILFLTTGCISFAMADILNYKNKNIIWLIENGHWCIVYIAAIFWDTQMGIKSPLLLRMSRSVKSGVYKYAKYDTINREDLEKTNSQVVTTSRFCVFVYVVAVLATLVKPTILEEYDPYRHFFNGWFPFEVNSLWRVSIVRVYELGCAWSAASGVCTFFVTFMAYSYHIEAHLKLLIQKIEKVFDPESSEYDYIPQLDKKIRECLGHHREILRVFNDFSEFCDPTIGCATLMATFMVCTLLYLMTNPDFDVSVIVTFSGVVAPEFSLLISFRLRGQRITDLSNKINEAIYKLKWLDQDVKVQKNVLMWLRLTSKPLELKSFGYRNVSNSGIKEVLQTSYTFFNMLKAST
uniref:Odorant receptor n=1 Tax=Apolygus lucorum TaxID=248454 RepID=A0A1Q1NIT1_APOLU|nr:olfactory receptor [Apolygus lucorum]